MKAGADFEFSEKGNMLARGGYIIRKELKELKEIREIMEKIYKGKKRLNAEPRVKKLRKKSEKFMLERKLSLKLD